MRGDTRGAARDRSIRGIDTILWRVFFAGGVARLAAARRAAASSRPALDVSS
ncbi:hypothetical protein [Polyangium sp. y55x31]|uniref:hypothetical protein n=1 Tax=Polyangium sp. y55x31 TaxID=3042688 RepID=UPI0024825943|nr:hypothetical protein [Polyangium sp. y55x31]MDI1481347.1 hypothetical protein [Polyangium sp. y55x31]